uniref:Glycosyltransferase n=1 Tax=Panagrolaimus superbus TaxID=310955 RepID=A0A914Z1R7_9BILA
MPDETAILKPYTSNVFFAKTFDILPSFQDKVQCSILFNPKHSNYINAIQKAEKWRYGISEFMFWNSLETSNICASIKNTFAFFDKPLSQEEAEYPLAYGMLVYKDIRQITYMLSAFYQPQNAYCIGIDGNAKIDFQERLKIFGKCFSNIHVFVGPNVTYGGPEIPIIVLSCLQKLNERKHPWKYYQYLSGADLPLKTNLEMAGIPPMPIWKSSLSSTFSRASANIISKDPKVYELIQFLLKTGCPDESLWATIAGNPEYIQMPGGFSAAEMFAKIKLDSSDSKKLSIPPKIRPSNSFPIYSYYISRYQVWDGINEWGLQNECLGTWSHLSCIYGIGDLPTLLLRPELVAHKFYLDKHPAAFFCLYKKIRERALDLINQQKFNASTYEQLPQIQLLRGKSIDNVKFFF